MLASHVMQWFQMTGQYGVLLPAVFSSDRNLQHYVHFGHILLHEWHLCGLCAKFIIIIFNSV